MINDFDEIKRHLTIREVIEKYSDNMNFLRSNLIICPFPDHKEKTESFKIYPEDNSFYCYGCSYGGTVIDFVMKMFNLTRLKAARKLSEDFSLGLFKGNQVKISKPQLNKFYEDKKLVEWFKNYWHKNAKLDIARVIKCLKYWEKSFPLENKCYKLSKEFLPVIQNLRDILIAGTDEELYQDFGIINYYIYSKFKYFL